MKRHHLPCLALTLGLVVPAAAYGQALDDPAFAAEIEQQLIDDVTPIPAGMGAVMVPSLTGAAAEPSAIVVSEGERIASGRTGERIVVPGGVYDVVVGHGLLSERARTTVRVTEGLTVSVPPFQPPPCTL